MWLWLIAKSILGFDYISRRKNKQKEVTEDKGRDTQKQTTKTKTIQAHKTQS
jgi:hypothetical protein